ncbi:MAG: hypothetical protein Q8M32_12810 [Brevundimonas sp.]|nr:hypothetical protein [Brevundimonas sp.]
MHRLIAIVVIGVLLSGSQSPLPLPVELSNAMDDPQAARDFDYFDLAARGEDLTVLRLAVASEISRRTGTEENDLGGRCSTEAETEVRAGLDAARLAADAVEFEADRAAADEARARWSMFAESILAGEEAAEQPFRSVSAWLQESQAATDPRHRELLHRVGRDQLVRHGFGSGPQVWGPDLSPGALVRVQAALGRQACEIDGENTAWLKADVAANGWYRVSVDGDRASRAAWLLAQHADRDPAFQRHVLSLLEPLVATGETNAANYAYLYDRWASGSNRPQRYGTQGRCTAKEVWTPNDLEDTDRVEALRAEVGIGSLAEYQTHMHRYCADFAG